MAEGLTAWRARRELWRGDLCTCSEEVTNEGHRGATVPVNPQEGLNQGARRRTNIRRDDLPPERPSFRPADALLAEHHDGWPSVAIYIGGHSLNEARVRLHEPEPEQLATDVT